ncbi:MAG TPA: ankyrin repeat domain-containing protein, partial [Myxococcota bacterium]|nr:ankyrin repeat domain-containing protein [Myxococcota bacterium]
AERLMSWYPLFVDDPTAPIIPQKDELFKAAVDDEDLLKTKKLIEDIGRSVNSKDPFGAPLACSVNSFEILSYLLKHKDFNKEIDCGGGNTPLHIRAANDNPSLSQLLIDNGFNVNQQNDDGNTPLHVLLKYSLRPDLITPYRSHQNLDRIDNFIKTAKLLIDSGTDLERRNTQGEKPLDPLKEHAETVEKSAPALFTYIK